MQSDLISRSEAFQRMVEETEQSGKNYIELSTIERLLNDVPTAYRPKKVMKQLEEAYNNHGDTTEHYKAYVEQIVRNGGKE